MQAKKASQVKWDESDASHDSWTARSRRRSASRRRSRREILGEAGSVEAAFARGEDG